MNLRLSTFGRTELVTEEKLPPGLTSGRPLVLLVYLAVERRQAFSRPALGDLLWGDRDEKAALRALRQALYLIRKVLPMAGIHADARQVQLAIPIPCDALELEEALRGGDAPRVAALYRGPFLGDLVPDWPNPFLQWVERVRFRYERLVTQVLLDAAESAVSRGSLQDATDLLHALEAVAAFDLASELKKVETWTAIGRADMAADVAQRALGRAVDLEIEVPPQARSRLERAVQHAIGAPGIPEAGSIPSVAPLTGRARERIELLAAWRRATQGVGLTALLLGDPGVGKSRLIEEIASQARSEGATVLHGRGYALESGLLYGALIEVLRAAVVSPGFAGVGDVWLSELVRLMPELRDKYPGLPQPEREDAGGRRRFYEAVAQVFESLAFECPVLCVLDDLHWADEDTLELLHYVGRRLCACPVLFVAGIRPGEASPGLRRLQSTLVREQGGIVIELGPLDRGGTRELVSAMYGRRSLPDALESAVWTSSEGNPLFAISMVEVLAERGCVSVHDGTLAWDDAAAAEIPRVPERMRELILARVAAVPHDEAEVLRVGAVAGRAFTSGTVARVLGRSLGEVDGLLRALGQRRLVGLRGDDGDARWEFTHDRLREVVYEEMTDDLRTALHGEVARATADARPGTEPASVALHASLAGDRDSAFRNALEAARWARSVFAFEGAREMLRVALANAPDKAGRAVVEADLDALPPPASGAGGRSRAGLGWRGWVAIGAVAMVTGLFLVASSRRLPSTVALPPLPAGLLVQVRQDGSQHLGIVDPGTPGAPVRHLPAGLLPIEFDENTILSPDGRWVAKALSVEAARPDVYVMRRDGSDTLRLTQSPDDDLPVAWFPDGSAVLVKSGATAANGEYSYGLTVARLDGVVKALRPGEALRDGWAFINGGAVSADGTRIVAGVVGASPGLWVMDVDGANTVQVREQEMVLGPEFSPDGGRIAFFEGRNAERLAVVSLADGTLTSVEAPSSTPGRNLTWSRDGREIYLSGVADGNSEIFAFSMDSLTFRRLTFSGASDVLLARLGPRPPYVDRVEVIAPPQDGGAFLIGDSVPVGAVARDTDGYILEGTTLRLDCAPDSICGVRGDWLYGAARGHARLVATAGGWRADTLHVEVVDPSPELVFSEDWEDGILTDTWQLFGVPAPVVVRGEGRETTAGFQANGDGEYESGVVSRRAFVTRRGLTIDFWGRGDFDVPWPNWQYLQAGITSDPLGALRGLGALPVLGCRVNVYNTGPCLPVMLGGAGQVVEAQTVLDPGRWHRYTLQVFPSGEAEMWFDGRFGWSGVIEGSLPPETHVVLQGRATHGHVIHDEVRVYEGTVFRR